MLQEDRMRFIVGVLLAISVSGCASFRNSFKGEPPMAIVKEYSIYNRGVMVVVHDNNTSMYCSGPDAANDITCEVGYGYLSKNVYGAWEHLSHREARQLCFDGLRHVAIAKQSDVEACMYGLLRIRFTQLVPEEMGKDY
jgi:hypothetical protein